jgi:hypothetical protein
MDNLVHLSDQRAAVCVENDGVCASSASKCDSRGLRFSACSMDVRCTCLVALVVGANHYFVLQVSSRLKEN